MTIQTQAGVWRHYKGRDYLVLGTARHSETGEIVVVYVPLYELPDNGGTQMAVRPIEMFLEKANVSGRNNTRVEVPRFRPLAGGASDWNLGGPVIKQESEA